MDIGSSAINMGFVVEGQSEEELPERLIWAVRIAQMLMGSAAYVETAGAGPTTAVASASAEMGKDYSNYVLCHALYLLLTSLGTENLASLFYFLFFSLQL